MEHEQRPGEVENPPTSPAPESAADPAPPAAQEPPAVQQPAPVHEPAPVQEPSPLSPDAQPTSHLPPPAPSADETVEHQPATLPTTPSTTPSSTPSSTDADVTARHPVPTDQPAQPVQPTQQAAFQAGYPQQAGTPAGGTAVPQDPNAYAQYLESTPTGPVMVQQWAPPPMRPPKPLPTNPKSTAGAILLNLTGLGIGYGYLQRWWRTGIAVVLIATIVVLTFVTDGASNPWLWRGLAVGWLAILGLDAWLVARRHPKPANQSMPVIGGAVAVAVVVAGYVFYGIAGSATYDDAIAAQSKADCAAAIDDFDTVTSVYEATLSQDVRDAPGQRQMCVEYMSADKARSSGKLEDAEKQYKQFDKKHPKSVLAPVVHDDLGATYYAQAEKLMPQATSAYQEIIDKLLLVKGDYGDTPSAKKVADAVDKTFTEATAPFDEGAYCDALPALEYFAGQNQKLLGDVVSTASTNRGAALYKCGIGQYSSGDCAGSAETLGKFYEAYKFDTAIPQAQATLISAKVCAESGFATPMPAAYTGDQVGPVAVQFFNDSSTEQHVLLAGPTAHDFTIPACSTCPESYPPFSGASACPVPEALPSYTVYLPAAPYNILLEGDDGASNSKVDSFVPDAAYYYCTFNTSRF